MSQVGPAASCVSAAPESAVAGAATESPKIPTALCVTSVRETSALSRTGAPAGLAEAVPPAAVPAGAGREAGVGAVAGRGDRPHAATEAASSAARIAGDFTRWPPLDRRAPGGRRPPEESPAR